MRLFFNLKFNLMKRKIFTPSRLTWSAFSIFVLMAGFSACKKSNDSIPANSASASLGTGSFQSTLTYGADISSQSTLTLMAMQIKSGDSSMIQLQFSDTIALNKAYDVDDLHVALIYTDIKSQKGYSINS